MTIKRPSISYDFKQKKGENVSRQYLLKDNDFLVSQTDTHGNIIFANDDFCKVSGYGLHELIGKPHNIVRHEDMPKKAFQELWESLKKQGTWSGYVKNKTKEGQYYWVYAMISTIKHAKTNETTYISCRRKPHPDEIRSVSELYRTMH
jgi:PAS domain S-box-containing protein